jgi:hypothetical protein
LSLGFRKACRDFRINASMLLGMVISWIIRGHTHTYTTAVFENANFNR